MAQSQNMNQDRTKTTETDILSKMSSFAAHSKFKENVGTVCNGTIAPPSIRGFTGPLNNIQLQKLMSSKIGYSSFEMYLGPGIDSSSVNTNYVYYLCDDRKVLNTMTNQRFFRLLCNSSKFEPGLNEMKYPPCYDPTHCVGRPAMR